MLTLLVLRHAKSRWDEPGRSDRERGLAPRGIGAARAIGRYLASRTLSPALALCSTATRARDTLSLAAEELPDPPPARLLDDLYHASAEDWLATIRREAATETPLLCVGHNPSMQALVMLLTGSDPSGALSGVAAKYPTAALAELSFEQSGWGDVGWRSGTLIDVTRPRDLG